MSLLVESSNLLALPDYSKTVLIIVNKLPILLSGLKSSIVIFQPTSDDEAFLVFGDMITVDYENLVSVFIDFVMDTILINLDYIAVLVITHRIIVRVVFDDISVMVALFWQPFKPLSRFNRGMLGFLLIVDQDCFATLLKLLLKLRFSFSHGSSLGLFSLWKSHLSLIFFKFELVIVPLLAFCSLVAAGQNLMIVLFVYLLFKIVRFDLINEIIAGMVKVQQDQEEHYSGYNECV